MRKIEKPWGYEEVWAETENYVGKRIVILPGRRLSLQYHEKKEETIYVMDGRLRVWESENDASFKDYGMGSIYHVKPGKIHRFGSLDGVLTVLIEVSTPELDDVVRIADDYDR